MEYVKKEMSLHLSILGAKTTDFRVFVLRMYAHFVCFLPSRTEISSCVM